MDTHYLKNLRRETKRIPKLVNNIPDTPSSSTIPNSLNTPDNIPSSNIITRFFRYCKSKLSRSFIINFLLLLFFVGFFIFFLYNCKHGIFKADNFGVSPFSTDYNYSLFNN